MIDQVGGDPAANGTFKIGNVSRLTFDLFDAATGTVPVSPTGTYTTRRPVELSAPSLRRLRRRPDEGFLPGDGGRCLGHLPRDARLRERRG